MMMFATFIFWLIIFGLVSFLVVPIAFGILGFIQGWQDQGNGFDDYVNSARNLDNR